MREAGVRQVVDAASLSVVGLVEVLHHIPRIYGEYRKLLAAAERERPDLAMLTDSPSFHLRLAKRLRRMGIPVVYLVAPQVWAWKRWRLRQIRRDVSRLLCIFPFEEDFFREHGVAANYIGHPLARLIGPSLGRDEFLDRYKLPKNRPLVALLPGSRAGESARHLPVLADAVARLGRARDLTYVLATPVARPPKFWEPISRLPIQVIEGQTWNAIAHADLALAASGTVTIEAALLGTPMVTFYKVTRLTWWMGRDLGQRAVLFHGESHRRSEDRPRDHSGRDHRRTPRPGSGPPVGGSGPVGAHALRPVRSPGQAVRRGRSHGERRRRGTKSC